MAVHGDEAAGRLLDRARSLVLVVDLQEGYRGKLLEELRTVRAAERVLRAAGLLGVPVALTEQYPKGLGPTRTEIEACLPAATARFEKTRFSCLGAADLRPHLDARAAEGRHQIVLIGIETHVCVSQTAHELLATGFAVHAVRDAITARFALEDATGWAKLVGAGAVPASSESVLFEWLRDARAPEFKAIHKLVI